MRTKLEDTMMWERTKPRLQYVKERANLMLCKRMVRMEHSLGMFDEGKEPITAQDALQYIDEKYAECDFPLDVRMFRHHQQI